MFITKKYLPRRTFLRGMGAAVALPLLDAMIPAGTALAQTAAKPMPRMAFIYFPHGALMDRWSPKTTGTDFELGQVLKPLEPFRSHLTIVSNLRNKAGESPAPHAIMPGTWLRCVAPGGNSDPDGGTTVDQIAARHIGQDTQFPSLELCTEGRGRSSSCDPSFGCNYGATISWRTPDQPLPMEHNPRKLFYQLFGQGDSPEERKAIVHETGSLLDLVSENVATLNRYLGAQDRALMAQYLESVREIERRVQKMEVSDLSGLNLPEVPVGVPDQFPEHLPLMFDLMALAYQANLTRIISFMMAGEVSMLTYNHVGVPDAFHSLSHHQNEPAKMDRLALIQTYHTTVFASFVKKLAEMPDGDGTMLDHSMLLFGSNMSNSNLHNNNPLPSAILGHGCGRIKGGQHLQYPPDTPLANLMLTMLDKAQVPVQKIGDSTAPFSEV